MPLLPQHPHQVSHLHHILTLSSPHPHPIIPILLTQSSSPSPHPHPPLASSPPGNETLCIEETRKACPMGPKLPWNKTVCNECVAKQVSQEPGQAVDP